MNILIIHPSFPGQYFYLCRYLAKNPENNVCFLAKSNAIDTELPGVSLALYQKPREITKDIHHYLHAAEEAVLEGQQTIKALDSLKNKGFIPDIIIGHSGWGSLMYIKDYYPNVPVIGYFEWYYHSINSDSYYWPDEIPPMDKKLSIRTKNMHHLLSLEACDVGITPTNWQKKQFPDVYKPMLHVIHEGTDTAFCCPYEGRELPVLELSTGFKLPEGTKYITYVSRGFEPIRGFDKFMDALRIVLKDKPDLHVLIAGTDRVCYGSKLGKDEKSYKVTEEEKGGYDKERVHFVGTLNRGDYKKMMQGSMCHVYLTRPFVLSWSMLEAMSFGLPLVASATPPVMEVVEDNVNGLLAEFRSPVHIAKKIEDVLDDREMAARLGKAARETVLERFDLVKCMRKTEDLMYSMLRK